MSETEPLRKEINRKIHFYHLVKYSKKKYIPLSKRSLIKVTDSKFKNN